VPAIRAVFFDIDGTQVREDIPRDQYTKDDLEQIEKLKSRLADFSMRGGVVVHATNRMAELVLQDLDLLARAKYITCSASTRILSHDPKTGEYVDDPDYNALVASCHFSVEKCKSDAGKFNELTLTAPINQTDRKVSYTFVESTPVERRREIHDALRALQPDSIEVFMVEDKDNHIIDFLPKFCTKAAVIKFIMDKEGLKPEQILAAGNSNNDIPMLEIADHAVAVADSRKSLLTAFAASTAKGSQHIVALEPNTRGVIWALDEFVLK
jgi:HAD superfamily hydrolase (TIGR01484 family)